MAAWTLAFTPDAEGDFGKLDRADRKQVMQKLEWLANHADAAHHLPLAGLWQGFFKLRVGDRRVIYQLNYQKTFILVYVIGRRDKLYKAKQ